VFQTVLIGLDGATFTVLDPLMEAGVMPRLAALAAQGVRGELLSTPNPVTSEAWPTMMTGRGAGHHGLFDFVWLEDRADGRRFNVATSRDLHCETIWSIASRGGRSVTSLNFFGMYPPLPVRGQTVSGFVPWRHLKDAIYPPELYDELRTLPGFDRKVLAMDLDLEKKCIQGLPQQQYANWIGYHLRRERQWFAVLEHLMTHRPTDLTAIVFDGVDKLQHLCWRLLDPALVPGSPSAWEWEIRNLCLDYFRLIDSIIGEILARAGPDARVFIVSDHGFGTSTEVFYANVWLHQHGLLEWADDAERDCSGRLTVERLKNHLGLLDWSNTKAYATTPSANGLFIRREKLGENRPVTDEEYETFRGRLAAALLSHSDPPHGRPVVARVRTREEVYSGAHVDRAPDLLLTLRDGGFISVLNSDRPLRPRPEPVGTHRPEGIFLASGPGLRAGLEVPPLSILDIAPTLLYSLGLPIPADLEGAMPTAIFEDRVLRDRPVQLGERTLPVGDHAPRSVVTEDEVAGEVIERLMALGYLE
jgi:predicted AlkP superfamily phosphohydrolase/phosphomutase